MSGTAPRNPAPWRRLDPRTLLVHCGWLAAPLGSLGLTALATGGRITTGAWITLAAVAASFAVVTCVGLIRWARTAFRVTDESFEVRSGLLTRRLRSVPLHRIRTVDLTATPLHRLLGVTVLRAGTASPSESGGALSLEALTVAAAGKLRAELLARADTGATAGDPLLARFSPRWLRYAPLTFWVVGGVFVAVGTVYRVLDGMGIELWKLGPVRRAAEEFGSSLLWLTIPAALLAVLTAGAIGATALYTENWWNYRLEWADSRTLRIRRGLFTTRAVTIERARLRGVLLQEPLLLRAGGGALVRAVAGGLGNREENRRRSAVLPPAPRPVALRVAGGTLRSPFPDPESAADAPGAERSGAERSGRPSPPAAVPARPVLARHPRAALRRRQLRGLLWAVLPGALVLAGSGLALAGADLAFAPVLLHAAWIYAAVTTPAVLWLARDAYRNLGHGVHGRHLVVRSGTFSRDTLALERAAIAAWTFTSTPAGRRSGLVTLTAAVAAGEGGYRIPDLAAADAPAFAADTAPGIIDAFLLHPDRPADG
ncbi:PH domain-containing protein [Streptomyces sp. NPDC048644]|uniref:PH domain-containing protein n=1 Tax=Streptomyces sp. NPDC048644 TaxID=3365582 RepID=UPI0037185936